MEERFWSWKEEFRFWCCQAEVRFWFGQVKARFLHGQVETMISVCSSVSAVLVRLGISTDLDVWQHRENVWVWPSVSKGFSVTKGK